jgi:hypothetical protein
LITNIPTLKAKKFRIDRWIRRRNRKNRSSNRSSSKRLEALPARRNTIQVIDTATRTFNYSHKKSTPDIQERSKTRPESNGF